MKLIVTSANFPNVVMILGSGALFLWMFHELFSSHSCSSSTDGMGIRASSSMTKSYTLDEFQAINNRLTSSKPDIECGWTEDCPRQYDIKDVKNSVSTAISKPLLEYMDLILLRNKRQAQEVCLTELTATVDDEKEQHTDTGGYCYGNMKMSENKVIVLPYPDRILPLPKGKLPPDEKFIQAMNHFIEMERVKSLSDFGAGMGGYGIPLVRTFPDLVYLGYDGAGDIEVITQSFINYFDLTIPLNLPITDWVLSLEVGEHIPVEYEGMMVRNLHAHNCKGIILSWARLKQGGVNHINTHSKEYLRGVFENLDYRYDEEATEGFQSEIQRGFLFHNIMVLRRVNPVC